MYSGGKPHFTFSCPLQASAGGDADGKAGLVSTATLYAGGGKGDTADDTTSAEVRWNERLL